MKHSLDKYFTDELEPQEKRVLLSEVANNIEMKEEFIESQSLMALIAVLPQKEDEEKTRQRLAEFMLRIRKE